MDEKDIIVQLQEELIQTKSEAEKWMKMAAALSAVLVQHGLEDEMADVMAKAADINIDIEKELEEDPLSDK